MVSITKQNEQKVRKITPAAAGIQRKATLVAMQLWLKSRTQKELKPNPFGEESYLSLKHGKGNKLQASTNQLLMNTKHLKNAKKTHANDKTNTPIALYSRASSKAKKPLYTITTK
jgi:hypothetical protein